jgi:hypothetical protein
MPYRPANLVHTDEAALAESTPSDMEDGSMEPGTRSSAGEHALHTGGVVGSIPTASTIAGPPFWGFRHPAIGEDWQREWFAPSFIYVIASGRDTRPVKIGYAANIRQRILAFEAGNPYGLRAVSTHAVPKAMARQVESRVHALFAQHAMGREWFDLESAEAAAPVPALILRAEDALAAYRDAILNEPARSQDAEERIWREVEMRSAFARARAMVAIERAKRRRA